MAKCSGYCWCQSFPHGSVVKNPPANAGDSGDSGLIPGSGRSPGGGNGNPVQYSYLGNPVDRGGWQPTVLRVAKSWTGLSAHTCAAGVAYCAPFRPPWSAILRTD